MIRRARETKKPPAQGGRLSDRHSLSNDQFKPPNSQTIRMIGKGMPISHNSRPRPMKRLLDVDA
ncbi:MAG: hypothetical protein M5U33_11915 [Pseudorhodoplanes sp.]|nr:hypothetical protein [Pseudorhodoplanes sp.]